MSTKVAPLGLRLFMEGVEVPVISASVSIQPDMPATAAIQVIPTDTSLYFLPRTLVHLFYLDSNLSEAEIDAAKKASDKNTKTRTGPHGAEEVDRIEMNDYAYKILFTGEVIGFNYKKTPTGRQMVLQCMDLSSYWDTCYQFFSDYSAGGNGLTDKYHQFVGAGSGVFDNLGGHGWVISNLLNSHPKSPEYQRCKGLLGGLIHLLEAVGGLRYREAGTFEGFKGVNDFFTIAELRYGLLSMLGAIEADETSAKLFAHKAFYSWIKNGMTSIGSLVSFRDMLNYVNRHIFHNIYPNPCAKYVPGGTIAVKKPFIAGTTTFLDAPQGPSIKADLEKVNQSMAGVIFALEQGTSGDPIDPTAVTYARKGLLEVDYQLRRNIGFVRDSKGSNASQVTESLSEINSDINDAIKKLPTTTEPGDEKNKMLTALSYVQGAQKKLDDLLGKDVARRRVKSVLVPKASYLFNQLFLPETFFVTPPRCNVIFPDQYYDLNFSRNFMREPTRLALQGGLGMLGGGRQGAQLFASAYLAPPIRDVNNQLLLASMGQGARVLLPHETHSGIIPKMEWVTDGHRWGVKAEKKRVDKVHFLQRLANFQFFLHRWSARQLNITGVFNPNLVAGFPAVIIDRSAPSPAVLERLEKLLRRRMLPTQFVGKVFALSHVIGQQGGSTSVQFVYARTHRGLDDEFLGILSKEIAEKTEDMTFEVNVKQLALGLDSATVAEETNKEKKFTGSGEGTFDEPTNRARTKQRAKTAQTNEIRKTVVRMWTQQKLKANIVVPGLGKLKKVDESGTVNLTLDSAANLGITYDYFEEKKVEVDQSDVDDLLQPEMGPARNQSLGVEVVQLPEKITLTYYRFKGTGRYERSGKSFEEIARPSWFSEAVWSNENITKEVYEPLIGTMAITDDTSLGQEQQDEMLKRWDESSKKRIEWEETTDKSGEGSTVVETAGDKFLYTVVKGSAEETIDGLSLLYSIIKEHGNDVHEFIREYTWRPIANMVDILGSQNLEFDDLGKVANPDTMTEGFHSRAFGDYNTDVQLPEKQGSTTTKGAKACHALMEGVADPASLKRPGLIGRDDKKTGLRAELDPRGRARGRVRLYVEELQLSRGLLGS